MLSKILFGFLLSCHGAVGFVLHNPLANHRMMDITTAIATTKTTRSTIISSMKNNNNLFEFEPQTMTNDDIQLTNLESKSTTTTAVTTAITTLLLSSPTTVLAAVEDANLEDIEIAELPPVWVPIVFAIVILGGVGLLTSSLGDVYTEEASLGLMSGARAKKEKERSRSSYFKNKQ